MKLTIFTDGGSRGNPGQAAYGYALFDENGTIIAQEGKYIGIETNNVAEYMGLLEALKKTKALTASMTIESIDCFADSNLVVQQMLGKFKIKAQHLVPIISQIRQLERELPPITYAHVYREKNTIADALVNKALDAESQIEAMVSSATPQLKTDAGGKPALVFVTQNQDKVSDAKLLLPDWAIYHVDFEVPETQSLDPKEIIEHKLKYAYKEAGRPCFVMDASLSFGALNGFPGPLVKWFYTTLGLAKVCQVVHAFDDHTAQWTGMLAYYDGIQEHFFEETVDGTIPESPRGTNGYAWDPIFIPKDSDKTLAEMDFEEKQTYAVTKKLLENFEVFLRRV